MYEKTNILKKIDLLKKIEEAKIKQKAGNSLEANQIFQVLLKSNNESFDLLLSLIHISEPTRLR